MFAAATAEDRAVSPVVGVVLLVAITVVLAAVVGAFALGVGEGRRETLQATFDFEIVLEGSGQPDEMRVTHATGDTIPGDERYLTASVQVQHESGSPGPEDRLSFVDLGAAGDGVSAGDSVLVEPPNGDPELEDKPVRVVWDDGTGRSAVLARWRGSEA